MALTLTCTGGAAANASDDSREREIQDILKASPGSLREDLMTDLQELAQESGISLEQATSDSAREARAALSSGEGSRSSDGGTVGVGRGRNAGDIFWDHRNLPAGHVGMYTSAVSIVEAPGPGRLSRHTRFENVSVHHDTRKVTTVLNAETQDKVSDFARFNLVGHDYNFVFWNNKGRISAKSRINCSQLVWYAYKVYAGLDLDGNGGRAVYPSDIYYSRYTTEYARVA